MTKIEVEISKEDLNKLEDKCIICRKVFNWNEIQIVKVPEMVQVCEECSNRLNKNEEAIEGGWSLYTIEKGFLDIEEE